MSFQPWRKPIVVMLVIAFVGMGIAWTAEEGSPQFQEKESIPVVKKHKRFPWLPVLLGVGAGVAVVLLLTRQKKRTLTVNLKVGTSGTPATTAEYKQGTMVNYNYAAKTGFSSLQVKLDGVVVPASGSLTMDGDHTLDVSASEYYTLTVDLGAGTTGTPAVTAVFHRDEVVAYNYSQQSASGVLEVRLDRVLVPASGTVTMSSNHTLAVRITDSAATFSNGVLTVNGVRYEMVLVPAGEFMMGSDSPEAEDDEQPVHPVRISRPFWLGKTEVTQGLWEAVMPDNPSAFKLGDNYPVDDPTWNECQRFIQSLNQMLGNDLFRLPTEAEWEYACRAGTSGERYGDIDAIAWYVRNCGAPIEPVDFKGGHTQPVGLKQPNAFGLYDMLGNVWEWCSDLYDFPYFGGYQIDPIGIPPGFGRTGHVYRGGSWELQAKEVRAANRDRNHPNGAPTKASEGLRLARTNG